MTARERAYLRAERSRIVRRWYLRDLRIQVQAARPDRAPAGAPR